jgi:hypothetical protein
MSKNVIGAGLLGAVVLMVWTIVVDGLLGFHSRIEMKQLAGERQVYETLKQYVVDPGRYAINPPLTSERRFPEGEPAFSVLYGGVGHEAAGRSMLIGLAVFLITPVIAAWMLSQMSGRVLSSYGRRVAFFVGIGLLFALSSDLAHMGIGGYPPGDAVILAFRHVIDWTLVGLVIAWRIGRPRMDSASPLAA